MTGKRIKPKAHVRVLKVTFERGEIYSEAIENLARFLADGWVIAACAAVRSDPFNRDALYYTITRPVA